jgi:Ca2+-binding RTX toxin-like protein
LTTGGTTGNDDLIALPNQTFDGRKDILFTGAGNDRVDLGFVSAFADAGDNRIDLGSGNDTIFVSKNDRVFGGDGNDTFEATEGKGGNRMSGGAGDDTFFLGFGDRAIGGDGNDKFFVGTGGGNLLSGGAGADQFWIATGGTLPTGVNTVIDFTAGTDVIGFLGFGAAFNFGSLSFANNDIKVGNAVIATLTGVNTSSLTAANFAFA